MADFYTIAEILNSVFSGDTISSFSTSADVLNAVYSSGDTALKIKVSSDLNIPIDKSIYIGDESTDDSWRLTISSGNLLIQKRVSGTWTTKDTISGS